MDQEIIDILNSTPRCVTRRVMKVSSFSLFNVIKHNSLGPNHTRKVDKSMNNTHTMNNVKNLQDAECQMLNAECRQDQTDS